jgi:hypothetical protein
LCLKNTIYLPEPVMNELKVMNELSLFKESTSAATGLPLPLSAMLCLEILKIVIECER